MPLAFDDVRFPEKIAYGATGGPSYSTSVVTQNSGREKRNINWTKARHRYEVSHNVKSQSDLDELLAFFHARKGKGTGFRLKDWSDHKAVGELIAVGNGVETEFYLTKSYVSGIQTTTRFIQKPVVDRVDVYLDSVLQTSGVTIDYTTGKITFDVAPEQDVQIVADFEFDVPVRFDTDQLTAKVDNKGLYSWGDIALIEIKL